MLVELTKEEKKILEKYKKEKRDAPEPEPDELVDFHLNAWNLK